MSKRFWLGDVTISIKLDLLKSFEWSLQKAHFLPEMSFSVIRDQNVWLVFREYNVGKEKMENWLLFFFQNYLEWLPYQKI